MKSITVKSADGVVLLKIVHRKNGEYDLLKHHDLRNTEIEVRDDRNHKVMWKKEQRI